MSRQKPFKATKRRSFVRFRDAWEGQQCSHHVLLVEGCGNNEDIRRDMNRERDVHIPSFVKNQSAPRPCLAEVFSLPGSKVEYCIERGVSVCTE